jgi:K+-transporting ATPase KdpF subunit
MLKIIGIVVIAAIAVVLLYATTRPDTFHVQRTATINAAPDKIFAHINDLHAWEAWSPYMKLDPAMKMTYSGAASGTGAAYEWEGSSSVGAGRVTITDTATPSKVSIKLDMLKPFASSNDVIFSLQPRGEATDVTWAMDAPNKWISKVMSVFINMDTMVGGQFEEGLANLKALTEK